MTAGPVPTPAPSSGPAEPAILPVSEHLVPGWLQRIAAFGWRLIAALLFGLAVVQAMIVLSTVTVAILIALIIAATFAPYVKRLRDRGWSRTKAAAGVSLLALGAVTLAIAILAIVFLPFLGALIYIISRPKVTAQDVQMMTQAEAAQKAASNVTPADPIAKLEQLKASGAITQPEYEALKQKAIES